MIIKKGFLNFVICYNENFAPLARNCCRTLSHELININACKINNISSSGFRSKEWYYFVRKKIELLKEAYDLCKDGDIIGLVDADIQFFNSQKVIEIWQNMKKSSYFYVGQAEMCCNNNLKTLLFEPKNESANTGFFLIKKSKEISRFLDDVLSKNFIEKSLGDQTAINESLNYLSIKRALLNPCVFCHGGCGFSPNAAYQHATGAFNLEQKISQLNHWKELLNFNPIKWDDPSFGKSCNYIKNLYF